jgi:transglutaminase-like putative cysteine protease
MSFSAYFRTSSYAMLACGTLTLAASGGIGLGLLLAFAFLLILSWKLENTKWQLSERIGLVVVLLALPLFYLDWKFLKYAGEANERIGVSALAHLILFLSAVKLLQVKADRDWVFLYLISFFEVLLAAGLSISPLFLATLSLYLLFALSTIIAFEIKKSGQAVIISETRLLVSSDSTFWRRLRKNKTKNKKGVAKRLPLVAFGLLVVIFALALPLFFVMPRYGGSAMAQRGYGVSGLHVGFSDSVSLGAIGRLQQGNQVVMRVRVEGDAAINRKNLRWRGVALDQFTGKGWRKSRSAQEVKSANERGLFQFSSAGDLESLTVQTFYMEPLDTPYLFGAPRVVALQGVFPFISRDAEGGFTAVRGDNERIIYKVYSDTFDPDPQILREDREDYPDNAGRYLQLPKDLDQRFEQLANDVIKRSGAKNRYDAIRAIESYLQNEYGYTLDLKAGGKDPLADFLFNVREGHCEYFASAMVVMLRTQGIAARVVNGFQTGEYNDASDTFTVAQKDAHSWVEVYFPQVQAWVTFDPTPAAGRQTQARTGVVAFFGKYAEALEMLWIQYVVAYDNDEQRSLASSFSKRLFNLQDWITKTVDKIKSTFKSLYEARDDKDQKATTFQSVARISLIVAPIIVLMALSLLLLKKIRAVWRNRPKKQSVIEFYERMTKILAARGLRRESHETPLEFAVSLDFPEAMKLTLAYNRVRFGGKSLSKEEASKIEDWLRQMETKE